jgi:hypothetical protein
VKKVILVLFAFVLIISGCHNRNNQQTASRDEYPAGHQLLMDVPIDPNTELPSPTYEPKTEEEKAAASEAAQQATAEKRATEEANLAWAKANCRPQTFRMHSRFFKIVSESPICLVRVVFSGSCPHGVTVTSTKQTSHTAHSVESLPKLNNVFFSQRGDKQIHIIADDNDGSVMAYIEEVEIWATSPQ